MNCRDIDRLLDDHGLRSLSAAERNDFDRHIAGCARCAEAASTNEVLLGERFDGPRPGLFAATSRWVAAQGTNGDPSSDREPASRRRQPIASWAPLGGLAVVAALIVAFVLAPTFVPTEQSDDLLSDTADASEPDVTTTLPMLPALPGLDDAAESAARYVEGEHFARIGLVTPFDGLNDRLTLWLFFLWSCLHCYELEPELVGWLGSPDAEDIETIRVPVQWNALAALHARAFYTADVLGLGDEINAAFFSEIHERGNTLASQAAIGDLFFDHGVDPDRFEATFESADVDARVAEAARLADRFRIDATPSFVVDGVYKTSQLDVAEWLIGERRDERRNARCTGADQFC